MTEYASLPRLRVALCALALIGLFLAGAAQAQAQVADVPADTQMRLGPFTFNPGLVFSSGYDTNPWRESLSDTTAIEDVIETYATPQVDGWLEAGNLRAELFGATPARRQRRLGRRASRPLWPVHESSHQRESDGFRGRS
jgi:hypothetical protein